MPIKDFIHHYPRALFNDIPRVGAHFYDIPGSRSFTYITFILTLFYVLPYTCISVTVNVYDILYLRYFIHRIFFILYMYFCDIICICFMYRLLNIFLIYITIIFILTLLFSLFILYMYFCDSTCIILLIFT